MNSISSPPAKAPDSPWRTIAPVVLALLIIVLGSRIPLPGLDAAVLAEQSVYAFDNWSARYSIFALGVMPLFTVLAYVEIAKLVLPSLTKWQTATPDNAFRMSFIIKFIILVITAAQGYSILNALAVMGLTDGSAASTTAGIASFVGASALLIWLATTIRLPGLENGLWWLLTISLLDALPGAFARSFELVRSGAITVIAWVFLGVILAIAVALVVVANRILSGIDRRGRISPAIPLSVLLWPPFLANIVAGYLMAIPLGLFPELLTGARWFIDTVILTSTAILIPLFAYAYIRLILLNRADAASKSGISSILLFVVGIQVLICVGIGLLNWVFPLPMLPNGGMLIVFVSVMLTLHNVFKGILPVHGERAVG